jgi:hypothetical protein
MNEALRYLQNAKEILRKAPVEDGRYAKVYPERSRRVKHVQEACGVAYLAVLKAIDEYLLNKGVSKKELPKSIDGYRGALQKYLAVRDGKLVREFESLYEELHIAGYYRALLVHVDMVKDALKAAKEFIEKIKSTHSTPRSEARGMLRVDTERRFLPRFKNRGLAPSNVSTTIP